MVWFRTKELGIGPFKSKTTKFIKKFKNDKPDLEYFGSGMCANYLYEPAEFDIRAYEIFPKITNNSTLGHTITEAPRSFELYKEKGVDMVRLVIRSTRDDIESYAKSLSVEYIDINSKMPSLVGFESTHADEKFFFDFELVNQFNFTGIESGQVPIINKLIHAMTTSSGCGIMIQFLFTTVPNWNEVAELSALNLNHYLSSAEKGKSKLVLGTFDNHFIPRIHSQIIRDNEKTSSLTYKTGKIIEKFYNLKAVSRPITLAIRGMIIGSKLDIYASIRAVSSVFSGIKFVGDSLDYFDYDVDIVRGTKWLENNNIGTQYAFDILKNNGKMWSDMRWGRGRDFVPFLCVNEDEFSIFVSLPTDQNLPISYRRQKLRGTNYNKNVYDIGNVI